MELGELLDFVDWEHNRLVNHYWNGSCEKSQSAFFMKLIEEVGELSEAMLMKDSLQRKEKLKEYSDVLEHEFADVILCTMILAREMNVDLGKALSEKIVKIKGREY